MKSRFFAAAIGVVFVVAMGSTAYAADKSEGCGKCAGYRQAVEGYWGNIKEDIAKGGVSRYRLGFLLEIIGKATGCIEKVCQEPEKKRLKEEYHKLRQFIEEKEKTGELHSPKPIIDDFSKWIKK